jgi:hypothetical protein
MAAVSSRAVTTGLAMLGLLACGRTNLPAGAQPAPTATTSAPTATAGASGNGATGGMPGQPAGMPNSGDDVVVEMGGAGGAEQGDGVVDIPSAESGSRLRAQFLVTPDGDEIFRGFFDSLRGESCATRLTSDGTYCIPLDVSITRQDVRDGHITDFRQYADPACKQPVFWGGVACEGKHEPRYVLSTVERYVEQGGPSSYCVDPDWEIRELGAKITPKSTFYHDGSGNCLESFSRSGETFFEESQPLPRDAFVAMHEATRRMPGRLRARELRGSDGARQLLGWFDSERNEACAFALAADLQPRCLPSFQAYGGFFSDAGCSVPAAQPDLAHWLGACGGEPLRYVMSSVDAGSPCAYGMAYSRVGPALPEGTPIRSPHGPCPAEPWRTADAARPFFAVGESIPAEAFVPLETAWVGAGRLRQERHRNPEGFTIPAFLDPKLDQQSLEANVDRWYDTERGELCSFLLADDGSQRCVPERVNAGPDMYDWNLGETGYFTEATCTSLPLATYQSSYCTRGSDGVRTLGKVPSYARTALNPQACQETAYSIWALGKELTPTGPLYSFNPVGPGQCIAAAFDLTSTYRERGTKLDASEFVPALPVTK